MSSDADFASYIREVTKRGTTSNGVFGVKVMMTQINDIEAKAAELERYRGRDVKAEQFFRETFPNVRYVWLTRRDKIRQAISWKLAGATGIYRWEEDQPPEFECTPEYDFESLFANVQSIVYQEARWDRFFKSVGEAPLSVVYEDLTSDFDGSVRQILSYLDIPVPDPLFSRPDRLRRQRNSVSEDWYSRYFEDLRAYFTKMKERRPS